MAGSKLIADTLDSFPELKALCMRKQCGGDDEKGIYPAALPLRNRVMRLIQRCKPLQPGRVKKQIKNPRRLGLRGFVVPWFGWVSGLYGSGTPSDEGFISKIAHLSVLKDAPLFAREFLLSKGIKLVVVEHLNKTHIDGALMIDSTGTPIVTLSLRYDRLDNFWFTLAHELAHLVLGHVYKTEGMCIVDDLESVSSSTDEDEKEASRVATEALIPSELWENHPARLSAEFKDVRAFARKADIHHSIVAGRIRFERGDYSLLTRYVGQGQVKKLFAPKRRAQD
jgi:hypothetical protein